MKEKIAEEFYGLVEFMKARNAEDVLAEFYERELGNILDYVESWADEEHPWESYVTTRIDEMMHKYGDIEVCGFIPDQERLRQIIEGE